MHLQPGSRRQVVLTQRTDVICRVSTLLFQQTSADVVKCGRLFSEQFVLSVLKQGERGEHGPPGKGERGETGPLGPKVSARFAYRRGSGGAGTSQQHGSHFLDVCCHLEPRRPMWSSSPGARLRSSHQTFRDVESLQP